MLEGNTAVPCNDLDKRSRLHIQHNDAAEDKGNVVGLDKA